MTASTRVEVTARTQRIARLGPASPLPMLAPPPQSPFRIEPPIPDTIVAGARYGYPSSLAPYTSQDDYDRLRSEQDLPAVMLENDRLRAVVLPSLGGRLWELVDRRSDRPLVHTPPAIQFANLALRNAWFAGGIEWNIGTRGHSPTTCSPLHTALVEGPDGGTVLRMWELERLRGVLVTIDVWLPDGSPWLFTRVTVRNPDPRPVPMYWWTNAAVRELATTRVLAPAASAFRTDYDGGVTRVDPADDGGVDSTWPARSPAARDFFFDLPAGQPRWIAAVDEESPGLAMLSTAALRGRKLFTWGAGPGGDRWQRWLNPEGNDRYFEIQSGLAQTQFEHVPLAENATVAWTEAFGVPDVDPALAFGGDLRAAVADCERRLAPAFEALARADAALAAVRDRAPGRAVLAGSGWGALEERRRAQAGEPPLGDAGASFGIETLGEEQRPWALLLDTGRFGDASAGVRGGDWAARLTAAPETADTLLHLGALAHEDGRAEEAADSYSRSLRLREHPHAHRGLALLALAAGDVDGAASEYGAACASDRADEALLVEAVTALLRMGRAGEALALLAAAEVPVVEEGRIGFLLATALARTGDVARAAALLDGGLEVPDLREGEDAIADLWREVRPDVPVPDHYRFDMQATAQHSGDA
jgi:tetratricopeptide (TPR) repeat protein